MALTFERFEPEKHYASICGWWDAHKWPRIPLQSLPENGLVAVVDGEPLCAGWVYRTDSNMAWMEWLVMSPKAPRPVRGYALDELIRALIALAMTLGAGVVFTSCRVPRLVNRLQDHGFQVTDSAMTNLVRVL